MIDLSPCTFLPPKTALFTLEPKSTILTPDVQYCQVCAGANWNWGAHLNLRPACYNKAKRPDCVLPKGISCTSHYALYQLTTFTILLTNQDARTASHMGTGVTTGDDVCYSPQAALPQDEFNKCQYTHNTHTYIQKNRMHNKKERSSWYHERESESIVLVSTVN